jgi:hypothetical protein
MSAPPEGLTLEHHRDLVGRERTPWARRGFIVLLSGFVTLGLLNVFGQRPETLVAESPAARLELLAPSSLRSGLYFEARFTIEAQREVERATLVLDTGWLEGMTLNTVEPAPIGEASRDGRIALELGRIQAGDEYRLFLHFQVNPTAVGKRSADVELYDDERFLLSVDRDITIWP